MEKGDTIPTLKLPPVLAFKALGFGPYGIVASRSLAPSSENPRSTTDAGMHSQHASVKIVQSQIKRVLILHAQACKTTRHSVIRCGNLFAKYGCPTVHSLFLPTFLCPFFRPFPRHPGPHPVNSVWGALGAPSRFLPDRQTHGAFQLKIMASVKQNQQTYL